MDHPVASNQENQQTMYTHPTPTQPSLRSKCNGSHKCFEVRVGSITFAESDAALFSTVFFSFLRLLAICAIWSMLVCSVRSRRIPRNRGACSFRAM